MTPVFVERLRFAALIALIGGRAALGQSNTAAPFLLAPIGARLTGLGGAGVADTSAVDALFRNPAAVVRAARKDIGLEYGQDDITKRYAAIAVYPAGVIGTFSAAAYEQNIGTQERTTEAGVQIATLYLRNRAYSASYATKFGGGLTAGVTYKYIQFRIDCSGSYCGPLPEEGTITPGVSATSAVDVGVQYDLPRKSPLHLGLTVRNAGFKLQVKDAEQADPLPTQVVGGVAYDVPRFERYVPDATLRLVADATTGVGQAPLEKTVHLGVEGSYQHTYFLRGGYSSISGIGGPAIGLGLVSKRFALDIATQLAVSQALGSSPPTYLGLRYRF
jgi:hypothetical protein